MKFIDFLDTIYTEAAEAAEFSEIQDGMTPNEFMEKLDETDAETIIAILCAEKQLNLATIVDKAIKAMEKLSFAELLEQINYLKDKEE